jgi:hypothetical protein
MDIATESERIIRLKEVISIGQGIVAEVSSVPTHCLGDYRDQGH